MLVDNFGRHINYLRVSVTDKCNFRCPYCKPQKMSQLSNVKDPLTSQEIKRLVQCFVLLGVQKVRLTGGEPLLRSDIKEIVSGIGSLEKLSDLSLTTNGYSLSEHAIGLRQSGLKRVNISLDTLLSAKFKQITGLDHFENVLEGIHASRQVGFDSIKINVVVMRNINWDEILSFVKFADQYELEVRFIELMPTQNCFMFAKDEWVPMHEVIHLIKKNIGLEKSQLNNYGVAEVYQIQGSAGKVGFISPLSKMFCQFCNRVRLKCDGHLKLCLHEEGMIDLRTPLRNGASDQEIVDIIKSGIQKKPQEHHLSNFNCQTLLPVMSEIGG